MDIKWNKKLTTCETCRKLPETHVDLTKRCKTLRSGRLQCQIKCKNKQKIEQVNRNVAYVTCKCTAEDTEHTCHWRLVGTNQAVDKENSESIDNWRCEAPVIGITGTSQVQPFRIPSK